MYGKKSFENKIPQKGVESEEYDCLMNRTVLRHKYKDGCILTFHFVGSEGGG